MGQLIDNVFHERGTWGWAMGQTRLGYTVRRPNGTVIPPKGNWSINKDDVLAHDWEIVSRDAAAV